MTAYRPFPFDHDATAAAVEKVGDLPCIGYVLLGWVAA